MKKFTKAEMKKLKGYWKELQKLEGEFLEKVQVLEQEMSEDIGIKDMIFFISDEGYWGIGDESRTMDLIDYTILEK